MLLDVLGRKGPSKAVPAHVRRQNQSGCPCMPHDSSESRPCHRVTNTCSFQCQKESRVRFAAWELRAGVPFIVIQRRARKRCEIHLTGSRAGTLCGLPEAGADRIAIGKDVPCRTQCVQPMKLVIAESAYGRKDDLCIGSLRCPFPTFLAHTRQMALGDPGEKISQIFAEQQLVSRSVCSLVRRINVLGNWV